MRTWNSKTSIGFLIFTFKLTRVYKSTNQLQPCHYFQSRMNQSESITTYVKVNKLPFSTFGLSSRTNLELNSWSKKCIICANFFFIFFWLSRAIQENGATSLEALCSWALFSRKWEIYSSSSGYAPKSSTVQRVSFIFIRTIPFSLKKWTAQINVVDGNIHSF